MSSLQTSRLRKWLLNSPPGEWAIFQLRQLLIGALRQGSIPQHVAFVMDGNRRFARSHHMETIEGHNLGFEALARVRCLDFLHFRSAFRSFRTVLDWQILTPSSFR